MRLTVLPQPPQWSNAEQTGIYLSVQIDDKSLRYHAMDEGNDSPCSQLFQRAMAGEFGAIQAFELDPVKEALLQKLNRDNAIAELTVTTDTGLSFNADERSQERMARAILVAQTTGQTATVWRLADNSEVEVTLAELKEALQLAVQALANLILTGDAQCLITTRF